LQVTLMSIPFGGDIGLEAHPQTDQFLRLDTTESTPREPRVGKKIRQNSL